MKINGELVRVLREEKSWSQEHLAGAAGLSARTVQRVESEGVASAETRLALAAALAVPVATLILGSSAAIGEIKPSWRIPRWGWLSWGIATAGTVAVIAFTDRFEGLPRQMALNLFPWLVLLGFCLLAIALVGIWQRSRLTAPRES